MSRSWRCLVRKTREMLTENKMRTNFRLKKSKFRTHRQLVWSATVVLRFFRLSLINFMPNTRWHALVKSFKQKHGLTHASVSGWLTASPRVERPTTMERIDAHEHAWRNPRTISGCKRLKVKRGFVELITKPSFWTERSCRGHIYICISQQLNLRSWDIKVICQYLIFEIHKYS